MEDLLLPAMRAGKTLAAPRPPRELRKRVLDQVSRFHAGGAKE
jgi:hypothetical protein